MICVNLSSQKPTNMKSATLQYSSLLSNMKEGMHVPFVISAENLLLKAFVKPQLAKLPLSRKILVFEYF